MSKQEIPEPKLKSDVILAIVNMQPEPQRTLAWEVFVLEYRKELLENTIAHYIKQEQELRNEIIIAKSRLVQALDEQKLETIAKDFNG